MEIIYKNDELIGYQEDAIEYLKNNCLAELESEDYYQLSKTARLVHDLEEEDYGDALLKITTDYDGNYYVYELEVK